MVLGLRSKSRKSVSTQVHYVIHVQEIKPWPSSQLLRSAQSVLLQWENGDQNSGSFASISGDGKIEFNKSFRLSVTLRAESSKKATQRGNFHKNYLEFHLYDHQNEKAVKSQLLGSATINLADIGIIKETKAISTHVNWKRSFRNPAQPILYVNIQPFDTESSGSSPKSSLSKELSLDREESESISHSINDGNDEDLGITSFTDDDSDDIFSTTSQTLRSAYETTGDNSKISKGGTSRFNGEFVQPLETSASCVVKEEVGESKQSNGIRSHSSVMGSATNDRSSLSKLPEESGRLANSSYKVPESIQQSNKQIKGALDKLVTSASYIPVGVQKNTGNSSQSQATQEDSTILKDIGRGQRYNTYGKEKVISVFKTDILDEDQEEKEKKGKGQEEQITMKLVENEPVHNFPGDDFRKNGKLRSATLPESIKKSNKQIKGALDKVVTSASYIPVGVQTNTESSSKSQVTQEDGIIPKDIGRGQRYNTYGKEKLGSVFKTDILDGDQEEKEKKGKGQEEQITMKVVENEPVHNFPEDDFRRKGKLRSATLPESIKQSNKQIKGALDKVVTSASYVPVGVKTNTESSSQSQVTQEDGIIPKDIGRGQRDNTYGKEKVSTFFKTDILDEDQEEKEKKGKGNEEQITMKLVENGPVHNFPEDDFRRKGKLRNATLQESVQQSNKQIRGALGKVVTSASYVPVGVQANTESSSQSQVTQEDGIIPKDIGRGQRYDKHGKEKVGSVFKTDILDEEEEEIVKKGKGQEEQITMKLVENEPVHNFPEDDFRRKGKLRSATLPPSRISHEQPKNVLIDEKLDDVATVKLPLDAAESYELFSKSQAQDQGEKVNTLKDVHVSAVCHPGTDTIDNIPNNKTKLKSEVQMLQEELREAAALEVSLYSVIAEHGSSANKVHAPARRLSRFYFHAYRAGMPATRASAAQSAVSGFVLISKACGNDVPRLTFWFSNLILLRTIVRKGLEKMPNADGLCFNSEHDGNGLAERSSLRSPPYPDEGKKMEVKNFHNWEDPQTFLIALEKVEAWIFSRIVESVWWQTLTPHMQPAAAKSSSSRKLYGRRYVLGDQEQGSFSTDLWKRAFKDACERLCPLRAGGHECGCLPVIARLVMEQLVSRLDVAMFNAILRESDEEMPTDPISDPISDSKVLPIPAGKSGFAAGAQLKNAIGNWSRWLSDLFGIDDSDPPEDSNENDDNKSSESETSFKAFHLLNALSDLMMLPFEMLADSSIRKEVCPRFGVPLIKRVLNNFVPDEFCPGPIPDAVFDALNNEDIQNDEGSMTNFPCTAASTIYSPPAAASVMGILQEVGSRTLLRSGSSVLKKSYTSDDELDDLDSPLSAIGIDDPSLASKFSTRGRKVVRYELLREAWRDSE